jgi:hypothetical protein
MEMMGWKSSNGAKDGTSKSNMSDAASRQVNIASNLQGASGRRASKNSNNSFERRQRGSGSSHDDKRRTSYEKKQRGSGSSQGNTHPSHHTGARQHDNVRKQPSKASRWCSSVTFCLERFFCFPFRVNAEGILFLKNIIKSRVYNALLFVFTMLLLFGSSLQTILFDKNADPIFDVWYLVGFGIFSVDIIMRSYAMKNYFVFQMCGQNCRSGTATPAGGVFNFGSFIFWCDVISNFTFLTDVTFVFPAYYSIKKYEIELDAAGIPVSQTASTSHPDCLYLSRILNLYL